MRTRIYFGIPCLQTKYVDIARAVNHAFIGKVIDIVAEELKPIFDRRPDVYYFAVKTELVQVYKEHTT